MQLFNQCELKVGKLKESDTVLDTVKAEILDEIGLFFPQFVGDLSFVLDIWKWKCKAESVRTSYTFAFLFHLFWSTETEL